MNQAARSLPPQSNEPDEPAAPAVTRFVSRQSPINGSGALLKDCGDRIGAALLLVLLAPLMLVIGLLVRLESPGPAIFRQRRHGRQGGVFRICKFRTMRVVEDGPSITQVTADDARVTPLGRFLRRTSLDELPQLINVLKGEMSLVGPRPHAVAHTIRFARVVENYAERLTVKPGITGLAQVKGLRGEVKTPEAIQKRVAADLRYIENWSLWLDLRILLASVRVVLTGQKSAY